MSRTIALVVAAGRGARAPGTTPKQFRVLGEKPVLSWSLEPFFCHDAVDETRVVIREEDRELFEGLAQNGYAMPIFGGPTRQDSVRAGLEALAPEKPERILVHDSARPFVSSGLISRVCDALETAQAVAPMLPVTDSLHSETEDGFSPVPRKGLFRSQTPQGFHFEALLAAHRRFAGESFTDDFALAAEAGLSLARVQGDERNMKLTTPEDFVLAERIVGATDVRTGNGIDAHRFGPGNHIFLCGVKIPHNHGLQGHSDADVGLHALTDAILGALGAGDIGMHFPSSDKRWQGSSSDVFLKHAAALAHKSHARIAHLDVTIICEEPKLAAHREAMRARIAQIAGIDIGRVSVKATTTDGLGFAGRKEGISAQATATLILSGT